MEDYASTIASDEELDVDDYIYEEPPDYEYEPFTPTALPSTPSEFAGYFPSTRRLCIRHDDTIDGNMNLRVDTEADTASGRKVALTLFHLRMHDLKRREFSFRRYCRESGREICHTVRKYNKPTKPRPNFQRSFSNALASLRLMTSDKSSIKSLKRQDSGYESVKGGAEERSVDESLKAAAAKNLPIPTNTTMLEFSNYAHVELKRRGAKSSKRYEFQWWGTSYVWRRSVKKLGDSRETFYHLYTSSSSIPIAHVVPEPRSPSEIREEDCRGGWVPPCSMWISDPNTLGAPTNNAE